MSIRQYVILCIRACLNEGRIAG